MASYTLEDIIAAANAKYASTDITVGDTVCVLRNPLRLNADERAELVAFQATLDASTEDEDLDQEAVLRDVIRLVAATPHQAGVLLEAIGGDLAVLVSTVEKYMGATQAGEASPSAA